MKIANYLRRTKAARIAMASASTGLVALTLAFVVAPSAQAAATDPALASAATFGVLSATFTNAGTTTINGDLGYTTQSVPATVNGVSYHPAPPQTGIDQNSALATLNSYAGTCVNLSNVDLSLSPDHSAGEPNGTYQAGVYCLTGAATTGTGITLVGGGTYIFLINGALNSVADQPGVTLSGGASACDVWWAPTGGTTLGAQTALGATPNFIGTDIDPAGISVGLNENWTGRALDFQTTVTTANDTISVPTGCTPPAPAPSAPSAPSLASATCTLTSSQNPSTVGQSVTFTAAIAGSNPTGSVSFTGNSVALSTSTLNASGQATFTTTTLAAGSDPLLVTYTGDGSNTACQSASLLETVNQAVTPTTVATPTPTTVAVPTPTPTTTAPKRTVKKHVAAPKPSLGVTSSASVPVAPPSLIGTTVMTVTG